MEVQMITPTLLAWAFALAMVVLCANRPNLGRIVFGMFFLLMALVNLLVTIIDPRLYVGFADTALIPAYGEFVRVVFAQDPYFYLLPIIAGQLVIGGMMLAKDPWVHLGILGGMIFVATITPLGIEELANLAILLALISLLREPFETTIFDVARRGSRPIYR
jgi:hypothetical protein